MCSPIAIAAATATLAAGQAVSSHVGQKKAYKQNRTAANLTAANEFNILEQQRVQLDQENSEAAFDTAIATAESQGRINASASDQGLSNSSLVSALNAGMFGIGRQASAEDLNDQNARNQMVNQRTGIELNRQSRINSVARPTGLSLVLGLAGAGLQAASAYQSAGGRMGGSKAGGSSNG